MKRYVMANRADGVADVVFEDDLEPHFKTNRFREIWLNRETPADLSDSSDPVADQQMIHEPPDGGAVFRMLVFPPKQEAPQITPEQMVEMHKTIHSTHIPSLDYLRTAKDDHAQDRHAQLFRPHRRRAAGRCRKAGRAAEGW
ncbi:MAG: hypothetical protein R3C16_13045 [Hyphomonadaceae bacterium]